jgi:heme exporter protein A
MTQPLFSLLDVCVGAPLCPLNIPPLNFTFYTHTTYHLQAPNGWGKTTLLRTIAGLKTPLSGHLTTPITDYLGHSNGLFITETMDDHLHRWSKLDYAKPTTELWSDFGFQSLSEQTPIQHLSYGQRRLFAFMRLCLKTSQLWLLDEPFTGLDSQAQDCLHTHIHQHQQTGGMVILTSHTPTPYTILTPQQLEASTT